MPLNKSTGNMYTWCTHTHSHLGGKCPHQCSYCYVQRGRAGNVAKYQGEFRIIESELDITYGKNKVIFIEHMNDLFALAGDKENDANEWRIEILRHCQKYPENQYVFQTKNPLNALRYLDFMPPNFLFGTTLETNEVYLTSEVSKAPPPFERFMAMLEWSYIHPDKTFITIEPVMEFCTPTFIGWIKGIDPLFVNIGADSKNCHLEEPSHIRLHQLISSLRKTFIDVRLKDNLNRLYKGV